MDISLLSAQKIEKLVAARRKLIEKFVRFAIAITKEQGVVTKREELSSHTKIVKELMDFNNFYFSYYFGQTCMGGNTIKICYKYPNTPSHVRVLEVYYQCDLKDCTVEFFKESDWQKALHQTIKNKRKIIREREKKKKEAKDNSAKKDKEKKKKDLLLNTAEKLGL